MLPKSPIQLSIILHTCLFFSVVAQTNTTKEPAKQSSSTDCPTWNTKKKSSKADYLEYLRNNQGKKKETAKPTDTKIVKNEEKNSNEKPTTENSTFYTRKRYTKNETTKETIQFEGVKQDVSKREDKKSEKLVEPVLEKEETSINTSVQPAIQKEETISPENSAKIDAPTTPEKNKKSKTEKKLTKLFSRKNNKAHKPNYKKCPKFS
ncbi:MAG: hypothetical protein J0M08_10550 [Bacteroidetes bacterium]|nr:hypothetical protein [Bacteroidota bacterium]